MSPAQQGQVLVGTDGSSHSQAAVSWAAAEAAVRGVPLVLVHAYQPVPPPAAAGFVSGVATDAIDYEEQHSIAREILEGAVARAREAYPQQELEGELIQGPAGAAMVDRATPADLVVLGSRGRGGLTGALLGSVSVQVSAHAACPVVIVRGDEPAGTGRVVVAVDGSERSDEAVGFAFAHAARHGTGVVALHAWELPITGDELTIVLPSSLEESQDEAHVAIRGSLSAARAQFPDVDVEEAVVQGPPARALVEASDGASLVVVGSRGRGGFRGLLLGSVSQSVLHHAHCPVAVVRHQG